jgi:hypothetical protein
MAKKKWRGWTYFESSNKNSVNVTENDDSIRILQ